MAGDVLTTLRNSGALVAATGVKDGLVHTPVTPFGASEAIDFDTYGKVLDFHNAQRPGAIALPTDAGERFSLRDDERRALVEFAVERVSPTPVIVDVTLVGSGTAGGLASHAQEHGAKAVFATTPYFQRPPAHMVVEHFRQIAASTDLAVFLYSSPRTHKGGVKITQDTVEQLMEVSPNVVGYIDGSLHWMDFAWMRRATAKEDPDFVMLTDAEYLATSLPWGGDGALSPLSAIAPTMVNELYSLCSQQLYYEARELQLRVGQLALLFGRSATLPATLKAALAMLGRPVGDPRGPIAPLDAAATERLRAELTEIGVLGSEPEGWDYPA